MSDPSDMTSLPGELSRKRPSLPIATPPAKRPAAESRSATPKPYKGLRHFSLMVCQKVQDKGVTSYNEVADELVQHVISERRQADPNTRCDEKNIRRRVYDALNVLMAMDIIQKDKKAISWRGLPTSAHADLDMLARERTHLQQNIQAKREQLRELVVQQVCFRNLVAHNQANAVHTRAERTIPLPFIVVNTHASAIIQCNMSRDLASVALEFSQPFEINDDNTILKRLGMHRTHFNVLSQIFPADLVQYAADRGLLAEVLEPEAPDAGAPSLGATQDYPPLAPPTSGSYL